MNCCYARARTCVSRNKSSRGAPPYTGIRPCGQSSSWKLRHRHPQQQQQQL